MLFQSFKDPKQTYSSQSLLGVSSRVCIGLTEICTFSLHNFYSMKRGNLFVRCFQNPLHTVGVEQMLAVFCTLIKVCKIHI